jgi:protein O-GlcNAc transferase
MSETPIEKAGTLYRAGKFADALKALDVAMAIYPENAGLWNNRGAALAELKRLDEAVVSFGRAVSLNPGFPGPLVNRANALLALGRYEEAARDYEKALALGAALPYARGNFLHCRLQCCDWRDFAQERARLVAELRAGLPVTSPLISAALLRSPEDQLRSAQILSHAKYRASQKPLWQGERYRHERIRLAYLSADFHAHATATLMAGVFESHDRARFETLAVSFGDNDASPMRARLEKSFERFIDATDKNDAEIAAQLRELEIDIAIDLKGYTANARPGIFAHRFAPIQAGYLGFPGSMGSSYIDYIIADRIVIPESARRHYSEKVVYLPDCYQANDSKRGIAARTLTRAEAGLPQKGFVFCCFNNSYKIAPDIFALWMRLLAHLEGSVLWLLEENPAAQRNLKREAEVRGVAANRLVFAPRVAPEEHLARHRLADLFLDTLPYNAHTTASDALWAGLPIVTFPGETFAGRVAASLLHAVGLPELIADSADAYEGLALKLAGDEHALSAIKEKLAQARDTCPLFDTPRFTRHLEAAYAAMLERHERGVSPAHIALEPIAARGPG